MLLGTTLTALVAYSVLPYNWSFELCMTFGSILAATDPVAVVALLKEVGASPSLTMLISGESMLNDGTAIVMFTIFSQMFLRQQGDLEATEIDVGVAGKSRKSNRMILTTC
jgi:NhaP-type Na+/H+ or K+/H+ antiporter